MIEKIEKYAKENNVPIMLSDGIEYLCNFILENNIKSILEIGTAIGYSAIRMALVSEDINVTTIERDKERYDLAINNIKAMNLDNRINVIYGDAMNIEVDGIYDLIFIDASKGHSIDFFQKYSKNLSKDGVIITDNLSFHGLVEDESLAVTRNQRGLVRKIKNFIDFLDNNNEYVTTYINVGDKISISKRKINIEAIFLDLDGTLLDDNKNIGDKTLKYLREIKDDIKIILASARPFCRIKPYLEKLELLDENNYTICFNGSLVTNNQEKILVSSPIAENIIIKIDNFILDNKIEWTYYLYDTRLLRKEINNIKEFVNANKIYKIVGISTVDNISKIRNNLPKYILDNLEITSSVPNRIEFVNKNMTKVNAIELLLNKLGIDKENTVAIGDGDNDIDMIKYVGYGIAMKNSPDIVKEKADIVTEYSNNEDGVYYIIKELLSKGCNNN